MKTDNDMVVVITPLQTAAQAKAWPRRQVLSAKTC